MLDWSLQVCLIKIVQILIFPDWIKGIRLFVIRVKVGNSLVLQIGLMDFGVQVPGCKKL